MPVKQIILTFFIFLLCPKTNAQTWIKDYYDGYDTIWNNEAKTFTYSPGHGAVIASFEGGSPGGSIPFYYYNYLIHVNAYGDSVWAKRNILDTTITLILSGSIPDTIIFQGEVESVIQLKGNGNYLVAGSNFGGDGFVIKQFDTLGNYISSKIIFDTTGATQQRSFIKLIEADSNNFFLFYGSDSFFYVPPTGPYMGYDSTTTISTVAKLDNNYNILWKNEYRYNYSPHSVNSINYYVDISNAIRTSDGGVAFPKLYDTCYSELGGYHYIEKLKYNGSFDWEVNLKFLINKPVNFIMSLFPTHDTCFVASTTSTDSASASIVYRDFLFKFNAGGSLIDSVRMASDTALCWNGLELSSGKYLFTSTYLPEFFVYDKNLNYVNSVPYPFSESITNVYCPPIANQYGGAFCSYWGGDPSYLPSWHMVGVNFDSLFRCYPSSVTGKLYQDNML